ncbi:MAG: hypothetical protein QM770_01820 [Tepidisphaeraceae bacterium]
MPHLHGMTWNHPRGIDPLVACCAEVRDAFGIDVKWDARSLEDFEAFPLDELAQQYDLMVIDHPHVGMAAASGCLRPFDARLADSLNGTTVGRSHESYYWQGKQWALAIDAAAQVSARRRVRDRLACHARRSDLAGPRGSHAVAARAGACADELLHVHDEHGR